MTEPASAPLPPDATSPVVIEATDLAFASIAPILEQLEDQIIATKGSQMEMNKRVVEMSEFLRSLNEDAEPYDLVSYDIKLGDSKRRISSTATMLGDIHDRLSRLQRQIAREAYKKKQQIKGQVPPPLPKN